MELTERVLALVYRIAQEVNGKANLPPLRTRVLSYSNGGLGAPLPSGATITAAAASFRIIVKLPVATDRWRIKLRNYDTYASVTKTAITGKKIILGTHSRAMTSPAAETGTFAGGTATTIVGSDFPIPGDGGWYTSPWVEAASDQFGENTEHLVGIAWSHTSSVTMQTGIGRCWYWPNATSGVDPAVAGSAATSQASFVPIDWVIEYETTSRKQAWLVIGDSIPEGTAGGSGVAVSPTSLHRSPVNQWATKAGILAQNMSLYGITAQTLSNPANAAWLRQDTSLGQWDGAIIPLGSNDLGIGRTLSQLQADVMSVIATTQSIIGAGKPIYLGAVLARGFISGMETARINYNNWIAELPTGVTAAIDSDSPMRTTASNALDAALRTSDGIHPSWQGQTVLATVLRNTVATVAA